MVGLPPVGQAVEWLLFARLVTSSDSKLLGGRALAVSLCSMHWERRSHKKAAMG